MGDLAAGHNADLNRLAEMVYVKDLGPFKRSAGLVLDPLDEQRLRDHQLRRLRRLWLKDQILSTREPLLPPKKLSWLGRFAEKEEAFWSKHLKFRKLSDYLYHGKDFHEIPKLWLCQSLRNIRVFVFYFALPMLPGFYLLKYGGAEMPGKAVFANPQVFPGDKYETVRRGDIKFDRRTFKYVPTEYPDEWQHELK